MLETTSWGFPQDWVIISGKPYVLLEYTTNISIEYGIYTKTPQVSGKTIKPNQIEAEMKFYSTDIDIDLVTEVSSDITMMISTFHTFTFTEPIITEYSYSDNNSDIVNMSIVALNKMVQKS